MLARTLRVMKYFRLRFLRLKGDPLSLAKGIAIGVFVGQTPTIPFQTALSLLLALLFRAAKIPALLASLLTTPFTYFAAWKIGGWLTPWDLSWERIAAARGIVSSEASLAQILAEFGKLGQETIFAMLLGGFVWAAPFALISFIASYYFFAAVRNKRLAKHGILAKNHNTEPPPQ